MNNTPLISLCIPTYNRGYILQFVLEQYIHDQEFDDDVEIVISDNCSSDDTRDICEKYSRNYSNIRYYRNPKNIQDANFYTVLDYGRGEYLKLINDWTYCIGESLRYMKNIIRENLHDKRPIFFTDARLFTKKGKDKDEIKCNNLDEYVQTVSTWVTSNNSFGVWKQQWQEMLNRDKYTKLKLQQEDWSFQLVERRRECVVYNKNIYTKCEVERKILTGYNWFEVHLDFYYTIMKPYIERGLISSATYLDDKHYLLEHFKREFCYVYLFNLSKKWRFDTSNTTIYLKKYYKGDPYLIFFFIKLPFYYFSLIIKSVWKGICGKIFK